MYKEVSLSKPIGSTNYLSSHLAHNHKIEDLHMPEHSSIRHIGLHKLCTSKLNLCSMTYGIFDLKYYNHYL